MYAFSMSLSTWPRARSNALKVSLLTITVLASVQSHTSNVASSEILIPESFRNIMIALLFNLVSVARAPKNCFFARARIKKYLGALKSMYLSRLRWYRGIIPGNSSFIQNVCLVCQVIRPGRFVSPY